MTDAEERRLTERCNSLVDELHSIPRGDPRHISVSRRLAAALRALQRYQNRDKN